jgi:hypothetical protein
MTRVIFGRIWEIKTVEDYKNAVDILEGNLFIASMSDDYNWYRAETDEAEKQLRDVKRQAVALGII